MDASRTVSFLDRLFVEHPRSLGLSWFEHGKGAAVIGLALIGAGCAAIIHALIPALFTETAGRTVERICADIQRRKSAFSDPASWPNYEI